MACCCFFNYSILNVFIHTECVLGTHTRTVCPPLSGCSVGGAHQLDVTTRRGGVLADDLVRDELLEVTLRASLDAVAGQAVSAERLGLDHRANDDCADSVVLPGCVIA